jgi:hypothetical protein
MPLFIHVMLTHHILLTPPSEASPEEIIPGANHSVDTGFHPNFTTATTAIIAVVTQATQNNDDYHVVNLANDNVWHHTPAPQPTNTSPEVPHGPNLYWRNGECPGFLILLHTFFWNLLPSQRPQ